MGREMFRRVLGEVLEVWFGVGRLSIRVVLRKWKGFVFFCWCLEI